MSKNRRARFDALLRHIREIYGDGFIPLHRPVFSDVEKKYTSDAINSNFVSSVGRRVDEFEEQLARFTGASYAVATTNGTAALHAALALLGVRRDCEVLSQALTFTATANAIVYCGAEPIFIDVDARTLGMCPLQLTNWLDQNAKKEKNRIINRNTGKQIVACVPMHTFGLPCHIQEIAEVCEAWGIHLIEDAAESLGSRVGKTHTGLFGDIGTFSFNGNKVITTGGGGMLVTNDEELAVRAKHLTTTAKVAHPWHFVHDEVGYNYRMPNLNAALGCAQLEKLDSILEIKRSVAKLYRDFCAVNGWDFIGPRPGCTANYWLNALRLDTLEERDEFLQYTNERDIMTRPTWTLMSELGHFRHCQTDRLHESRKLAATVVNVPSSVPDSFVGQF